jgi:hypothetical protein
LFVLQTGGKTILFFTGYPLCQQPLYNCGSGDLYNDHGQDSPGARTVEAQHARGAPGGRTAFCTSEGYQVHKQSLSRLWKIQSLCYWEKISQMMARKGGGPSSLDTSASVLHGEDTAASLTRGGMDMPNKNVQFTSRAGKNTPGLMDRGSPKRIRRPHPPRSSPGELSEGGWGDRHVDSRGRLSCTTR